MNIFDWQAEKFIEWMNPKVTRRMAAGMFDLSAMTFVYAPFSGEPPVIYLMSAAALMFSALLALVEAQRWTKDDPEEDPDQ